MQTKITSKLKFSIAMLILLSLIVSSVFERIGWPNYYSLAPLLGVDSLVEVVAFNIFPLALLVEAWLLFKKSIKQDM